MRERLQLLFLILMGAYVFYQGWHLSQTPEDQWDIEHTLGTPAE